MDALPVISDAEWEVMEVLWATGCASAEQVVATLAEKRKWNPRTVKTLLNRLLKKRALDFELEGKRYLYRPRAKKEACVKAASQSFLVKVFGGNRGAMLCRLVDEIKLSEGEIAELRQMLERKAGRK